MNDAQPETSSPSDPPTVARYFRDGEPDWDIIDFDVLCSRCGYNLRMLTQPRCPECGLTFDWWTVLDRSAWQSDFLFEHHARRRPVRSYFTTLRRALRPIRFWKQVSIHHRIHVKPLLLMFAMAVPWFFGLLKGLEWLGAVSLEPMFDYLSRMTGQGWTFFWFNLTFKLNNIYIYGHFFPSKNDVLIFALMLAVAFGGTFGFLCTLRQTLGRCRVRTVQLLRVVTYGAAAFCLLWPVLIHLMTVASVILDAAMDLPDWWELVSGLVLMASFPVVQGLYVGAGLKHYLRLPRPYILAFTAVFVGDLLGMTSIVVWVWF